LARVVSRGDPSTSQAVVRIAVVQPVSHAPPDDEQNVAEAVTFVEQAAAMGADFVAFPESYPGPWRMPASFDPTPAMQEVAVRCGVHVQFGTLQPIDSNARSAYQVSVLARADGEAPGVYRRTHPPGPWIYADWAPWQFEYVAANEFPVFETRSATVGLAVCSEVYMPEVSRALALGGAEIIFIPAGTDKLELWETWRTLIWARAIENLAIVVTTQNLFSRDERGLAMVAAPEYVVLESTERGIFAVDVDLGRVRELRRLEDDVDSRHRTKAGVLSQWQRPELYDVLRPRRETPRGPHPASATPQE
jgi:predicted amidohydrolase